MPVSANRLPFRLIVTTAALPWTAAAAPPRTRPAAGGRAPPSAGCPQGAPCSPYPQLWCACWGWRWGACPRGCQADSSARAVSTLYSISANLSTITFASLPQGIWPNSSRLLIDAHRRCQLFGQSSFNLVLNICQGRPAVVRQVICRACAPACAATARRERGQRWIEAAQVPAFSCVASIGKLIP